MDIWSAFMPLLTSATDGPLGHTNSNPAKLLAGSNKNNEAQSPVSVPTTGTSGGLFGSLLQGMTKDSSVSNTLAGAKAGGLFSNATLTGMAKDIGAGLGNNLGAGNVGVPALDSSFMQRPLTSMAMSQLNPVTQPSLDPAALLQTLLARQLG